MGYWVQGYNKPILHYGIMDGHTPWIHPVRDVKKFDEVLRKYKGGIIADLYKQFHDR
jgi:hypothetical protein